MQSNILYMIGFGGMIAGLVLLVLSRIFRKRNPQTMAEPDGRAFGILTDGLAKQIPVSQSQMQSIKRDILRAGEYHPAALNNFFAVRNFFAILLLVAAVAILVIVGPENQTYGLYAGGSFLVLAFLAYAIPRVVLHSRGNRRIRQIERGLADGLDMVSMCVGSGMSVRDALVQMTSDIAVVHPELGRELEIVHEQAELGTLEDALEQFQSRTDSDEVRMMVSMISDSERLGSDIQIAGQNHADHIRQQFRQRADERSNIASVKVMLPFVLCILPAFLILFWGPSYVEFRTTMEREMSPNGALSQDATTLVREVFDGSNDSLQMPSIRRVQLGSDARRP